MGCTKECRNTARNESMGMIDSLLYEQGMWQSSVEDLLCYILGGGDSPTAERSELLVCSDLILFASRT